jgi:hypothetical protein
MCKLSGDQRRAYSLSLQDRRRAKRATGIVWKSIAVVVCIAFWLAMPKIYKLIKLFL